MSILTGAPQVTCPAKLKKGRHQSAPFSLREDSDNFKDQDAPQFIPHLPARDQAVLAQAPDMSSAPLPLPQPACPQSFTSCLLFLVKYSGLLLETILISHAVAAFKNMSDQRVTVQEQFSVHVKVEVDNVHE